MCCMLVCILNETENSKRTIIKACVSLLNKSFQFLVPGARVKISWNCLLLPHIF